MSGKRSNYDRFKQSSHPSPAQAVTEHVAHDLAVARPDGPATRAPSSRRRVEVPTDDLLATLASANRIHGAPLPRVIRAAAGRAARPRREYGLRLSLNAFGGRLDDEANFVRKCLDVDLSFGDKFADSAALKRAVEAANGAGKTGHSLRRGCARSDWPRERHGTLRGRPFEMIARRKMSHIEWKATEIRPF